MPQTLYIPNSAITGPNISNSPQGAEIQPSATNPIAVPITTSCPFQNIHRLNSITVNCFSTGGAIKHLTVSFGDFQVLDTDVSMGFKDFTLPGRPDVKAPGGFQDVTVVLGVDASAGIVIENIMLTLNE